MNLHGGAAGGSRQAMATVLAQITDLHIQADPAARICGRDTLATAAAVVEAVRAERPALVLATGDLADDGSAAAYRRLQPLLRRLPCPVAALPGNHDLPAAMAAHLACQSVSLAPAHRLGAWTVLMLDSTVAGASHGHLGRRRLAALDRRLAQAAPRPTLVAMHHQPAPIGSPLDGIGLDDSEALWRVLDRHRHVRALLWGHIHHVHEQRRNGVALLGTPSTAVQFRRGADFSYSDQPPAWRRLLLGEDGRIETAVMWVETPAARPPPCPPP